MLNSLSDSQHTVTTCFCFITPHPINRQIWKILAKNDRLLLKEDHRQINHHAFRGTSVLWGREISNVRFKKLSSTDIEDYIVQYQPFDKAGGYGIQDDFPLIQTYSGSYYNIMGLSLESVSLLLEGLSHNSDKS